MTDNKRVLAQSPCKEIHGERPSDTDYLRSVLAGKTVVYVADIPIEGGATNSLIELTDSLQRLFDLHCIVLTAQKSILNDRLDHVGVENYCTNHRAFLIPRPQKRWKVIPKMMVYGAGWLLHYWLSIRSAERQVDFSKVSVVHSNLPRNDLGEAVAQRHGIPHITHLREFSFKDFDMLSLRRNPARFLSDESIALIAISKAVAKEWVRLGASASKIHVIYNGVDVERISSTKADFGRLSASKQREESPLRLVFLGGLNRTKGIDEALEAVAALIENGADVSLDIYGSSPNAIEDFLPSIKTSSLLRERIKYLGYDPEVTAKLNLYDAAIVCSKSEAFGRVVVECNAAGLPVIGASRGAIPELIRNGKSGLLYGGDTTLAACILRLDGNRDLLADLQRGARECAWNFTKEKNAYNVAKLYAEILAGGVAG